MRLTRRTVLAAPALIGVARAQDFPTKPIRLIVPFAAGGTTDLLARYLAERLPASLGQTVVVDNRPGAGGNVGAEAVAKAEPDGHTLLMCTIGTAAINHALYPRMPFAPTDLAAVSYVAAVTNVLIVRPDLPARNVAEFTALLRARPGELNFGSPGNGTSGHLCAEYFKVLTNTQAQHVPFRGSGPMLIDLIGGRVDFAFDNLPTALPHIRDGRLKALAVTSEARWFAVPELPTMRESGLADFEAVAWFGVQAPARAPSAAIGRLARAIDTLLKEPAANARMRELGALPVGGTPEQFQAFINAETAKWAEVVRRSGARID